ncbi:uncharacterized protein BKA55DRAFT_650393 [Fusarium redolens]|uniref:Uncharacterized protein n=1 Tax=Fusarium redolens TaxID=48865 RepID=A0A9P9GLS2_FUSRE|nr:uncharacterized protein BKA55DRAFT_650393 [Fusarium redolens]KAH7240309.1 hypothetical protein BKA55DRAFT_650393 [Fusarium redolens]
MIVALEAVSAWESQWNWVFEAAPLETIEEKGAYSIRSKVLYEFGIKWKTASAVNVASAGASFSLNAQANLDISNGVGPTLQSKKGWEPQVTYSYPVFTASGGVSLIPYVRWGVEFDIDIYNQSMMKLRNGVYDTLYSGSSRAFNQCFEAPDMIPTAEDIAELSEFAGEFCTSYLDYRPPRTTSISTATSTSGSTTTTEYVTSWVPPTAQYVVLTITSYFDRTGWPQSEARTVTTFDKAATFTQSGLKRRDATATQQLAARVVFTPGLVQNWDNKKISFACKQIATGTETVTQPVTTTIGFPYLIHNTWYLSETGRLITQDPYARGGYVAAVRNSNNIIFGTPASNPNPDGAEALYCQKDPNDVCSGVLSCSTDTRNGLSFTAPKYDWYRQYDDVRFYNDFRPRLGDSTPGSEMAIFTWEAASCACE